MRSIEFVAGDFPSGIEATGEGLPANAQLTAAEVIRLTALFDHYVASGGRGDLIPSDPYFRTARGAALKTAYGETHKDGRLAGLREELKRLVGNRCPCCGGARPGQLDHHLPSSKYQEFSLFPANLVASCGECNNTKRVKVGAGEESALLHPYFDQIPDIPFMAVTLALQVKYVSATVAFDDTAPIADPLLKARMRNHFNTVDINKQLQSEMTEMILEMGMAIDLADPNPSVETVAAILLASAETKAAFFGEACWQTALLRALATDHGYCSGGYRATRKTSVAPAVAVAAP